MTAVVADTHAAIWLLTNPPRLSAPALQAFQNAFTVGAPIYLSAISIVEVIYLTEKGRLPEAVLTRLLAEFSRPGSSLEVIPLDTQIAQTAHQISRLQVPEMPDRIIAATARYLNIPLVTRDLKIRATDMTTIW